MEISRRHLVKMLSLTFLGFNIIMWFLVGLKFTTLECVWDGVRGLSDEEKRAVTHVITSEYQGVPTRVKVLLPKQLKEGKRYKVLYILPTVSQRWDFWWNSGFHEAVKYGLCNKYDLICVGFSLEQMPWFGDHPINKKVRQESYIVNTLIPFIDRNYPALQKPEGRLLLGFSKAGSGAFTLLLRYPEFFGKAAAWDVPLMYRNIKRLPPEAGLVDVFGTEENFRQYYFPALLKKRADMLKGQPVRLILMGYGLLKDQVEEAHLLMESLQIPHVYDNKIKREHKWQSGWMSDAVSYLIE